MKKLFDKTWGWYRGLPWWGKILGVLVLVLVILLGILYLVSQFFPSGRTRKDLKEVDDLTGEHTDALLDNLDGDAEEIKKGITNKKKELTIKVNQAKDIDAETLKRREKIETAATMEDLDKLQEEFDL